MGHQSDAKLRFKLLFRVGGYRLQITSIIVTGPKPISLDVRNAYMYHQLRDALRSRLGHPPDNRTGYVPAIRETIKAAGVKQMTFPFPDTRPCGKPEGALSNKAS